MSRKVEVARGGEEASLAVEVVAGNCGVTAVDGDNSVDRTT